MIFFLINLLFFVAVVAFSLYIDSDGENALSRSFVNLVLSVCIVAFSILCILIAAHFDNVPFINLLGRLMIFALAFVMVMLLTFCLQFPSVKSSKVLSVLRIVLLVPTIFFVIKIKRINFAIDTGFKIDSSFVSEGLTWYDLFRMIYLYGFSCLSALSLLFCLKKNVSAIYKQQAVLNFFGVLIGVLLYVLMTKASQYIPAYSSLVSVCLIVPIVIMYLSSCMTIPFDVQTVLRSIVQWVLTYGFTAFLVGLLYVILLPMRQNSFGFFIGVFAGGTVALVFLEKSISKKLKEKKFSNENDYKSELENQFIAFDYNQEPEELIQKFVYLMETYTETSHVEIMLDNDAGFLTSAYNSRDKKSPNVQSSGALIDFLAGAKRTVIFKHQATTVHDFAAFKEPLAKLFEQLNAEAFIVLRESHHLFGIIALGPRRRGNDFSDYDYKVFTNLYSYFFLFGFYMKNIANQALVGTVDREIQFSSQIVRSIQENVDVIKNPNVDVGYLSRSARSLGGDFIDFIRLTDKRYMMIMGDVSGKGLNASMSMVILKSIIRTMLAETSDFKELIEKVNHFIKFNLPRGTFFAGLFSLLDFEENVMYYVNCGLPVLFLYTESYNNVIEIQGDGKVLGFVKKITNLIKVKKIKLNKGDIVLACTDGLLDSESLRGEMYGKDRVQKLIIENKSYDSSRLVQFVFDDMLQFTSKDLQDDVTAIAIRMLN